MRRRVLLSETGKGALRCLPEDEGLRRAALRELLEHAEGEYTLEQWQDAVCYLTGVETRFESAAVARRYAQRCLQGKAQER